MRRPLDPYQAAKARQQYDVQYQALLRQDEVIRHYQSKQYEIVCDDDVATRKAFGIAAGPVADLVVRVDQNHAIIAEVKGKDLDHALEQLAATVEPVRKKFRYIACKVLTAIPVPPVDRVSIPGANFSVLGYEAIRLFHRGFPGEWPLLKILNESGSTEFVRLGDEPVSIVFGPFAPKVR
jgi:hypothetical protein